MIDELARLAALSPNGSMARLNALVRQTCGRALSLPPLPAESEADEPLSEVEKVVVEFAEQFSVDVSMISTDQRERLTSALGAETLGAVVLMYIADFVPRVLAGVDALGLTDQLPTSKAEWDHRTDPASAVFNEFLPAVVRQSTLDPVTSEIVRLRGGGGTSMPDVHFAAGSSSVGCRGQRGRLRRHRVLRGVESVERCPEGSTALCGCVDLVACRHCPGDRCGCARPLLGRRSAALELTFDVMRNASNKIAVAVAADTPRAEHGTERYQTGADGQPEYE